MMMKKKYEEPTCKIYQLQYCAMILCGSTMDTLPDSPDYDDWLGAPEFEFDDEEEML